MIYILFGLLAGLGWAIWFILQLDLWIPLTISGVMGVIALAVFIYRRVQARRGAAALEAALAEQGKQQVMNARPERRAEIQALQKQINDGISALKSSKVGGKKRGAGALYSLPWYAIIGPPGAGKTTALRHSGLVFPYADSSIKGVGGTRNCDWWFTNDAIILDTAGRYAIESDDQQEWFAFLDMLKKYRSNKPLNGLLVAVSIPDIIDSNEAQLEAMGKKLRARIDEVMTRLRMVLPVYFVVTKCDLVAGFSEFFGDLRKSERGKAFGATLTLKEDKSEPGAIFAREFDALVSTVHRRAVKRLALERNRQAREAIYQFPIELAGIKRNLQDLVSQVFMVNAFQGTPIFRGFYFTSGTQEGAPMGRVLQRMGQAMGIQQPAVAHQAKVESKSYFLTDVFMRVVFPDADIAARSASEVRRQRITRILVSAAAFAVAFTFAIPAIVSFVNNRELLATTEEMADEAADINWKDGKPIGDKLLVLDKVRARLEELDQYDEDLPWGLGFLMYSGDEIHRPLRLVYVKAMQIGFVAPSKEELEKTLVKIKGERYYDERETLKQYLMLSDVDNLDVEWATGQYTNLWAETFASTSNLPLADRKKIMEPHVRYYFELIKPPDDPEQQPRAKPVPQNDKVVDRARKVLQSVPAKQRYFSLFVESINYELLDPTGDKIRSNKVYPPLNLHTLFLDRPETHKYIKSRRHETEKKWLEVPGPYTARGHYRVLANIKEAGKLLEREQWVVPLTDDEKGEQVAKNIGNLAGDYEEQYIKAWEEFVSDIRITVPANLTEAKDLYKVLLTEDWPLLRVIRAVEDHTQWNKSPKVLENEHAQRIANRKVNQRLRRATGLRFDVDLKKIAGKTSKVPPAFKNTVSFGVPEGGSTGDMTETPLAKYQEQLGKLREVIVEKLDESPDANVNIIARDLRNLLKEIEAQLGQYQSNKNVAQRLLYPLLYAPINVGGKIPPGIKFRAYLPEDMK